MIEQPASLDTLLRSGALLVLAGALAWALLILLAVVAEGLSGGRVRLAPRLGCPPRWHRWLVAAVSAVLAGALMTPPAGAEDRQVPALDGLVLPDRPTDAPPDLRAREPPTVSAWVTVLPGDSLWAISRRLLPPDAPPGRVAELTHDLYDLNRSTVGADPDLIRPGQRLHVPPAHETYSEDS